MAYVRGGFYVASVSRETLDPARASRGLSCPGLTRIGRVVRQETETVGSPAVTVIDRLVAGQQERCPIGFSV